MLSFVLSMPLSAQYIHPFGSTPFLQIDLPTPDRTFDSECFYAEEHEKIIKNGIIPRLVFKSTSNQNTYSYTFWNDFSHLNAIPDSVDLSLSKQINPLSKKSDLDRPQNLISSSDSFSESLSQLGDPSWKFSHSFSFTEWYFDDVNYSDSFWASNHQYFDLRSIQRNFSPSLFYSSSSLTYSNNIFDSAPETEPYENQSNSHPDPENSPAENSPMALVDYPVFASAHNTPPPFYLDVFKIDDGLGLTEINQQVFDLSNSSADISSNHFSRNRRGNWNPGTTYDWDINDFDPDNSTDNPKLLDPDGFSASDVPDKDDNNSKFKLNITATGGIDSLAVLAYGMTGGNALNDYNTTDGFLFMTAPGWNVGDNTIDVTDYFKLTTNGTDGIDHWLNGYPYNPTDTNRYTNLWGIYKQNDDFYLTYTWSNLNYSPVPEPSTYFMTGALFCLIGCNRASRNAMIKFIKPLCCKFFGKQKQLPKSKKEIS